MNRYRLHGCIRCGGTMLWDEGDQEWRCLLCARVTRVDNPVTAIAIDPALLRGKRGRPRLTDKITGASPPA